LEEIYYQCSFASTPSP